MMRTLVYIASGGYRKEYENLKYDRIYLVDTRIDDSFKSEKVIPLKMDALESVNYFKKNGIRIDCLVCLCESRGEGGQTYSMCSDVFMGYIMPIMPQEFIWIANDSSYYYFSNYEKGKRPQNRNVSKGLFVWPNQRVENTNTSSLKNRFGKNFVSLDLPYQMEEL